MFPHPLGPPFSVNFAVLMQLLIDYCLLISSSRIYSLIQVIHALISDRPQHLPRLGRRRLRAEGDRALVQARQLEVSGTNFLSELIKESSEKRIAHG